MIGIVIICRSHRTSSMYVPNPILLGSSIIGDFETVIGYPSAKVKRMIDAKSTLELT